MRVFIYYLLVVITFLSCNNTQKTDSEHKHYIELQISRAGANYSYPSDEKPLPNISDEIYKFSLDTLGDLKSTFGYGIYNPKDLQIKIESSKHENVKLSKKKIEQIYTLANVLTAKSKPKVDGLVNDDWFVKLKIDNEIFTYYLGQTRYNNCKEYKEIVTEIVKSSTFEVEDWKWY